MGTILALFIIASISLIVVRALDYDLLLRVASGYCISEIEILDDNPIAGKTLAESRPADMGVVILSIRRGDGTFTGAPGAQDRVNSSDVLTVYGHEKDLAKLNRASSAQA